MRGEGSGQLVFNGCELSAWEDENVPEMHNGDGYLTVGRYLMPWNCAL